MTLQDLHASIHTAVEHYKSNTALPSQHTYSLSSRDISLARYIDHTLLKTDATQEQIDTLCAEAISHNFKAVCVRLQWVEHCIKQLRGHEGEIRVACVVGFHEGTYPTEEKVDEANAAMRKGAGELDMVLNWNSINQGKYEEAYEDVHAVVDAVRQYNTAQQSKVKLKVILETSCLASTNEIIAACVIARLAGADFVKTSTGFAGGGATVEHIQLMSWLVREHGMEVKASGGVRTREACEEMLKAGATRIGMSSGVSIVKEGSGQDEGRSGKGDESRETY